MSEGLIETWWNDSIPDPGPCPHPDGESMAKQLNGMPVGDAVGFVLQLDAYPSRKWRAKVAASVPHLAPEFRELGKLIIGLMFNDADPEVSAAIEESRKSFSYLEPVEDWVLELPGLDLGGGGTDGNGNGGR